jgi:hypothetical protein
MSRYTTRLSVVDLNSCLSTNLRSLNVEEAVRRVSCG